MRDYEPQEAEVNSALAFLMGYPTIVTRLIGSEDILVAARLMGAVGERIPPAESGKLGWLLTETYLLQGKNMSQIYPSLGIAGLL